MELSVAVLGRLEVDIAGSSVDVTRLGARERAVLALLGLNPQRLVTAARLIDELWPEGPPERAGNALQVYVSRIRRTLGRAAIQTDTAGYVLAVEPSAVDVAVFASLCAKGHDAVKAHEYAEAAVRLREALALWRGDPFADCAQLPGLQSETVRLQERRLLAVEDRIDADLGAGNGPGLIDELTQLVDSNPYRERLLAAYMMALCQAGQHVRALDAYAVYYRRCVDELGMEPGPRLQQLQMSVLTGDLPLSPDTAPEPSTTTSRAPAPATPLLGRARELAEVVAHLGDDARLVTILGPGGVGKTRLALEISNSLHDGYADGVCWVPLDSLTDVEQVLPAIAQALGLTEGDNEQLGGLVRSRLTRRDLLLVLDNAEHLLPGVAGIVSDLLAAGPRVRLLVTSRVALRMTAEHRYLLSPLELPSPGSTVAEIGESPAASLFLDRARAVRPGLSMSAATAPVIEQICARLDGLPLAIELAAARCNLLPLPSLLSRLEHRFSLLTMGNSDAAVHHRSLRSALAWSVDLLSRAEQRFLARLAVTRGGFTLAAAEAIGDFDGLLDNSCLDLLTTLLDASLISRTDVAQSGADDEGEPEEQNDLRFAMLETIREFAAELLAAAPVDEAAARDAHATYYADLFADVAGRVPPLPITEAEVLRVLDEHDNVRVAVEHARGFADGSRLAKLVLGNCGWQETAGMISEQCGWLQELADVTRDTSVEFAARTMLGALAAVSGRNIEAVRILDAALATPAAARHSDWRAVASAVLAMAAGETGRDLPEVLRLVTECVSDARGVDDPTLLAFVLSLAGSAAGDIDQDRSVALLEEAVKTGGRVGNRSAWIAASNLAELYLTAGNAEEARRWALVALQEKDSRLMRERDVGRRRLGYPLDLLGASLLALGQPDAAEVPLREALTLADWADDDTLVTEVLGRFAVLAAQRGDGALAAQFLQTHLDGLARLGEVESGSGQMLIARFLADQEAALRRRKRDSTTSSLPRADLVRLALGRYDNSPLHQQALRS